MIRAWPRHPTIFIERHKSMPNERFLSLLVCRLKPNGCALAVRAQTF